MGTTNIRYSRDNVTRLLDEADRQGPEDIGWLDGASADPTKLSSAELAAEVILALDATPSAAPWHERILLESIRVHAVRLARLTLGRVPS